MFGTLEKRSPDEDDDGMIEMQRHRLVPYTCGGVGELPTGGGGVIIDSSSSECDSEFISSCNVRNIGSLIIVVIVKK